MQCSTQNSLFRGLHSEHCAHFGETIHLSMRAGPRRTRTNTAAHARMLYNAAETQRSTRTANRVSVGDAKGTGNAASPIHKRRKEGSHSHKQPTPFEVNESCDASGRVCA